MRSGSRDGIAQRGKASAGLRHLFAARQSAARAGERKQQKCCLNPLILTIDVH